MDFFRRSRRDGQVNTDLLMKVRKELEGRYSRPAHGGEFLSRDIALEILTRDRVGDLFRKLYWYEEDNRDLLYPRMAIIICILITINFERWGEFTSVFFTTNSPRPVPRFVDKDLPIQDARVLPPYLQHDFMRQQYTFLPVVIMKDTHQEYDAKLRLPILRTEQITGAGSQGDVDKVYIERGYLDFGQRFRNTEVRVMARKRITRDTRIGQKSFQTERHNLEQFRKSLINHNHIMQSFASFVYGPDFVILSDWADGHDLNQFLNRPDLVLHDYVSRSIRFSPYNLFTEAYSLAEALDFLHHRMVNNQGARYKCAHLDLKPENILVCLPESGNPADAPVGRWKITDFGLSNVEVSVARDKLIVMPPTAEHVGGLAPGTLLGELSLHPLRRGRGPFQPPEVRDSDTAKPSTRRDVWSFGCILAMILAFALGGPEEVAYQQQCRSEGTDDFFYRRKTSRIVSGIGVDAEVKPDLRKWLVERAPGIAIQHAGWVQSCSDLILRLLQVDVINRPEMNQAVTDLQTLLVLTEKQAQYRIWDFDASTLAPEPIPAIPDMHVTADTDSIDSPGPYVGVRTNSSGSSGPGSSPTSPSKTPSRSTLSIATRIRPADPSARFIKLDTMSHCRSAGICAAGSSAVFWSDTELLVYDLSKITDTSPLWQESLPRSPQLPEGQTPLAACKLDATIGYTIRKVAVKGPYLTVLEFQRPSTYVIHIHAYTTEGESGRLALDKLFYQTLTSEPDDIRVSAKGSCLIRFFNKVQLVTLQGSSDIPTPNLDVMGFDFTGDGETFCLWTRNETHYCWNMWDSTGRRLTAPVMTEYKNSTTRTPAREAFLVPFHGYPRFIACDKYGRLFLICADAYGEKVQILGRTENVFASIMLPDDAAFLLVRASEYSDQKLQRVNLTSMDGRVTSSSHEWGVLPKNMKKGVSGICVRTHVADTDGIYVLTLSETGYLVRKVLR